MTAFGKSESHPLRQICGYAASKKKLCCPFEECIEGKKQLAVKWSLGGYGSWKLQLECGSCKSKWSVCRYCKGPTHLYFSPFAVNQHEKKYHRPDGKSSVTSNTTNNDKTGNQDESVMTVKKQKLSNEHNNDLSDEDLPQEINTPLFALAQTCLKKTNLLGSIYSNESEAVNSIGESIPLFAAIVDNNDGTGGLYILYYSNTDKINSPIFGQKLKLNLVCQFQNNNFLKINLYHVWVEQSSTIKAIILKNTSDISEKIIPVILFPTTTKDTIPSVSGKLENQSLYYATRSDNELELPSYCLHVNKLVNVIE